MDKLWRLGFAAFFGLFGIWFVYQAISGAMTGLIVPKSELFPIEATQMPVLFWAVVVAILAIGIWMLRLAWKIAKDPGPDR